MDEIKVVHICPDHDTLDHDLSGRTCWCHPTFDIRWDKIVVLHSRTDEHEADLIRQDFHPEPAL